MILWVFSSGRKIKVWLVVSLLVFPQTIFAYEFSPLSDISLSSPIENLLAFSSSAAQEITTHTPLLLASVWNTVGGGAYSLYCSVFSLFGACEDQIPTTPPKVPVAEFIPDPTPISPLPTLVSVPEISPVPIAVPPSFLSEQSFATLSDLSSLRAELLTKISQSIKTVFLPAGNSPNLSPHIIYTSTGGGGSNNTDTSQFITKADFDGQINALLRGMGNNITPITTSITALNTSVSTGALSVSGNASVGGTLSVTGTTTLSGSATISGNTTIGGTLTAGSLSVTSLSSGGAVIAPYFTATSSTASSTFPNLLATFATTTNATSTNLFVSNTLTLGNALSLSSGGTATTTFQNGGIVFSDGTKLTQDNSNLFWDDANNRLGVGKSNPSFALDVVGKVGISGTQMLYNATANGFSTGSLFFGTGGGSMLTGANYNTGVGFNALNALTSGSTNTAVGYAALSTNTSGGSNTALGVNALIGITTQSNNVAIGYQSLLFDSTSGSTAVGTYSGYGNATAYSNTGVSYFGFETGYNNAVGSDYNTLVGYRAGREITTGNNNTIVGQFVTTGSGITTGSNNILIGKGVRAGLSQTGSNQLNIGNLIFGTSVGADATLATGNLGIGTSSPGAKLSVTGAGTGTGVNFQTANSSNSPLFTILDNGNVGVGTSTPWGLLSVNANALSAGTPQFVVGSSSATNFIVANNGNVGVGTSTPGGKFMVKDLGELTKIIGMETLGGSFHFSARTAEPDTLKLVRSDGTGKLIFNLQSGLNADTVISFAGAGGRGSFVANGSNQWLLNTNNGPILINNTSTGNVTLVQGGGNVGINVSSPSALLHISSTTPFSDLFKVTAGSNNVVINSSGSVGIATTSPWGLLSVNPNALSAGTPQFVVGSSTATNFIVANNGNVGVGTTSPYGKLTITERNYTKSALSIENEAGIYNFHSTHNVDALTLSKSVGTTNLIIHSSNNESSQISFSGAGGRGEFKADGTYNWYLNTNSGFGTGHIYLNNTSAGGVYMVAGGGKVGIATTSPWGLLSVNPNALSAGTPQFVVGSSTATNFIVTNGGNVGVGTVAPLYTLDVAGFINTNQYSGYKQAGNTVLYASTTNFSTAVGIAAPWMSATSSPFYSTAIGYQALNTTPTSGVAQSNTAVGYQALSSNTTGNSNTASGYRALFPNTTGDYNTANGVNALRSNTTGSNNTANGVNALFSNTTGQYNTANGVYALRSNTTGWYNAANGSHALFSNTTGQYNTANGSQALYLNTTGQYNTANGYQALSGNTSATNTTAIGYRSGFGNSINHYNQGGSYLGYQSGFSVGTNANYNTLIGYQAGYDITTGTDNIVLGTEQTTGSGLTTGSNNILIGKGVRFGLTGTASNQLNIGNLIYATGLGSENTASTGLVGIGTSTPWGLLSVNANALSAGTPQFVVGSSTATNFIVANNGNVGVGTTNPLYNLSIGASNYGITKSGADLLFYQNGVNVLSLKNGGGGYVSSGYLAAKYNATIGASFNAVNAADSISRIVGNKGDLGNLQLFTTGTFGWGPTGDALSTAMDSGISRLSANKIGIGNGTGSDTSGTLIVGNLGIATTSPWGLLSVNPNALSAGTPQFVVGSSTATNFIVTNGGNVGVGTVAPSGALHVVGDGTATRWLGLFAQTGITPENSITGSAVQNKMVSVQGDGGAFFMGRDVTNNIEFAMGTSALGESFAGSLTNHKFSLRTNNTNKLTIDTSGNIGIATTSPWGLLSVNADAISAGTPQFVVGSSTATNFIVANNGNVGVGTTNPTSVLYVYDSVNSKHIASFNQYTWFGTQSNASPLIRIENPTSPSQPTYSFNGDSDTGMFYPSTGSNQGLLAFATNGSERMRITSSGSVGIATTSPSARLALTQSANTSAGGLWIAETGNTDFRSIFMDTSGVMSFTGGDTGGTLNTATLNAAGEWTNASDIAYKDNILDLPYGLEELAKIQPRSYTMKGTNKQKIGFIAQELEKIIPEVVEGTDGSKGISYGNFTAFLTKAVQELSERVEEIFVKNNEQDTRLEVLERENAEMRAQLNALLGSSSSLSPSPTPAPAPTPSPDPATELDLDTSSSTTPTLSSTPESISDSVSDTGEGSEVASSDVVVVDEIPKKEGVE